MKKIFALVLVVALFCGLNIYLKNDGKVKNELTGEVVDYPFAGTEHRYYGRKAIPVDDTLEVSVNRGNVTVFNHNEFYSEEGECVVEIRGDIKKSPEVKLEDGLLTVAFDESENVEDIKVDMYLANERQYDDINVTLASGELIYCGLDTSEVTLVNQDGDVQIFWGRQGATKVNVNAKDCNMHVGVEAITEICWETYCTACEYSDVFDTFKHDGSDSVFCNHGEERHFYERTFSENEPECYMNIFGTDVNFRIY